MGIYFNHVIPFLTHQTMKNPSLVPYRERVVASAHGHVLEIGVGSGLNMHLYPPAVERVTGLDPSSGLLARARRNMEQCPVPVRLQQGVAESMPFPDDSFDSIVLAWTLCTIPDAGAALGEMRRVLKPDGRLYFVEHGSAPESGVRRWQDALNPIWRRVSGGCRMNLPIPELLRRGGFRVERLESGYVPGPRVLSYLYEGEAVWNGDSR